MTQGNLLSLAGVYTISFLGVMTMFAVGNLILRVTRPDLKRTYQGPIVYVLLAALATIIGIVGNILIDPKNIVFFFIYFLPAICIVLLMIYRDYVLDHLVNATKSIPFLYAHTYPLLLHVIKPKIIVFAHTPEKLYASIEYIRKNETSRNIVVVYCVNDNGHAHSAEQTRVFEDYIRFFKDARIFPLFSIEFVIEDTQDFGPEVVRKFANRYRIHLNNVFVGSIHETHDFSFEDLGGVRIIQ